MDYNSLLELKENFHSGEVYTPEEVVNRILNEIPERIWKSKDSTFLDPCCGTGTFLKAIINKLRQYGHTDENIAERVYGIDNNFMYCQLLKQKGMKHIFYQSFLDYNG